MNEMQPGSWHCGIGGGGRGAGWREAGGNVVDDDKC